MAAEPQPPLAERLKLLGLTEETTSGTFATVSSAVAENYYNIKCEPGDFYSDGKRMPAGNYVGSVASVPGKKPGKVSFDLEIRPGGTFLTLLTGAGFKATTGTYAPTSSLANRKTWSVKVWEAGRCKKLSGVAWNVKIKIEDGKPVVASFDGQGVWEGVIDEAMPAQAAVTSQPYVSLGIAITVASATPAKIEKAEIDLGAKVELRADLADAQGIAHFLVTSIDPTLSLDTEARKVADQDAYGLLLAGTTQAVSIPIVGGGHTLTLSAPAAQRVGITDGARAGMLVDTLNLDLHVSSGDDALSLVEA